MRSRTVRGRWAATLAGVGGLLAGLLLAAPPAAAAATCADLPAPHAHDITCEAVTDAVQSDGSILRDVTMTTPAIFQPSGGTPEISPVNPEITVRVYLPPGYDPDRATGYRSLYLLNGGSDNYDSYTAKGDIVSLLRGTAQDPQPYDGIVVMPTGGMSGWYTNWAGRTDGYFAPQWETYHIEQLLPWIDGNFNTSAVRAARGIAGVSMGGFGALRYAARHPDLFSVAGALSPGIELRANLAQKRISDSLWQAGAAITLLDWTNGKFRVNKYVDGVLVTNETEQKLYRLDTLFGPHTTAYDSAGNPVYNWPSSNPGQFADDGGYAPYHQKLALYAGGCAALPTTSDDSPEYATGSNPAPESCAYSTANTDEPGLGAYASRLDATLTSQGIQHRYCYGTAGHDWAAWKKDLVDFLHYAYGTAKPTCNHGA